MKINQKYFLSTIAALGLVGSLAVALPASAQTNEQGGPSTNASQNAQHNWGGQQGERMGVGRMHGAPGIFGTVSAISGNTITVNAKVRGTDGSQNPTTSPYTVDATNATVMKNGATSTVSSIAVGDTVMVQGTLSGTNITAKTIRDGIPAMGQYRGQEQGNNLAQIKGNGQPVVAGNVTSINGNTLNISNPSNATYTIDVTNAIVYKANATSTVSSIAVGDNVLVQGTVNGSSVTASTVIDHGIPPTSNNTNQTNGQPAPHQGFFQRIGGFFAHLFGF